MSETLPILFREKLEEYDFGAGHPFRGDRFVSFLEVLKRYFGNGYYELIEAEPAEREELLLVADKEYIEFTKKFFNSENAERNIPEFSKYHSHDNLPRDGSGGLEEAARLVVGQAKKASDLIRGDHEATISIGGGFHHAKPNHGEGFCLYNDVAFAAKYLLKTKEIERVMILDTDAHFGNGTYEYFLDDPRVLQVDLHQNPATIYPGSGFANQIGEKKGEGYTINIPMPERAGDDSYRVVFEEIVKPAAEEFEPQVVVRNGGGDPYFGDQLTNLGLSIGGLRMIGSMVSGVCEEIDSKLVDLIVSGYSGKYLHLTWMALIAGLMGKKVDIEEPEPPSSGDRPTNEMRRVVERIKDVHGSHWSF